MLMESSLRILLDFLRASKLHTIFKSTYGGKGHILMLHRVVSEKSPSKYINNDLEVTSSELEQCIQYYIKNNYSILPLDQVYDIIKNKKVLKNKFVAFTFDDGYADIFINAYPLFKKYNIPFAVNVATGYPDGTAVLWWYLLEDLLTQHHAVNFVIGDRPYSFNCATALRKYMVFMKIRGIILRSYPDNYLATLHSIFDPYQIDLYKKTNELALSWEQIRALSDDPGVTIAAHTVDHPALNRFAPEAVRSEIMGSVQRLEEKLGKKIDHFSYPFGRGESGAREFEIVRACGFKTATTTRFANIFDDHCDHLCCLPRIYKFGTLPKMKYLEVFASGALSALIYKFKQVITD
jgi:peptidoglycan/xylan/chitin deacetylase (PgdA/CDA1 family)